MHVCVSSLYVVVYVCAYVYMYVCTCLCVFLMCVFIAFYMCLYLCVLVYVCLCWWTYLFIEKNTPTMARKDIINKTHNDILGVLMSIKETGKQGHKTHSPARKLAENEFKDLGIWYCPFIFGSQ